MATGQYPNEGRFTRRRSPGGLGNRRLRRLSVLQVTTAGAEQYGSNSQAANKLAADYFWGVTAGGTVTGTAAGAVTVAGAATGTVTQAVTSGTAAGAVTVSGAATGTVAEGVTSGTGSGSVNVTGAANGTVTQAITFGTAVGSVAVVGTATGTVTQAVTFALSAAGFVNVVGLANGTVTDPSAPVEEDMSEFAHITGLGRNSRRTEILRAKGFAELTARVAALETLTAPSAWTAVTFQNSWVNFGGSAQTVQYRKVGDRVEVRGVMKSGTNGTVAFTLPSGFRPPALVRMVTDTNGTATVAADGTVTAADGVVTNFSIGFSFSVTA